MNVKLTIKAIEALTLTFEGQSEVDRLKGRIPIFPVMLP